MRFREVTVYNDLVAKATHLVAYVRSGLLTNAEKQQAGLAYVDPLKP